MSKAMVPHQNNVRGVVPAVASAFLPGLGQLFNGEREKALGVFVTWAVTGATVISWIPIIGPIGGAIAGLTWVYAIADGFFTGRKKR